jgi:3-phenylpropionate/trans-cinnamate dioxygenase ferredoxin subunit
MSAEASREVKVCAAGDVAVGSVRRFDIDGYRLAVVRLAAVNPAETDAWYVVGDRCSHQDYSLAEGEVWPEEREIECPKHGSTFSLVTGEALALPATRPVPVYAVRVDGDDVWVRLPDDQEGAAT